MLNDQDDLDDLVDWMTDETIDRMVYFSLHSDHRQTLLTCLLISTKREDFFPQLPLLPGLPRVVHPVLALLQRLHQDDLTALGCGCLVVVVAVAPAAHRVHGCPSCLTPSRLQTQCLPSQRYRRNISCFLKMSLVLQCKVDTRNF